LRNRQFFGISPVFSIIGPLFCSVFLVIYSNTMVLYIVSIVIATDVAGAAERHPGEASATAGDAARAPAGTVHLCAHLHGVVVLSGKVPPRLEQIDHVGFLVVCYGDTCFLGTLSFGRLSDRTASAGARSCSWAS
jgi:hypothetical protein